ncbi:hypothetical protein O1611_g1722 [Lasiodiplodia mahajangana]|uniref:Uncharacterized protein n=1 Tax=Lasiodiplodia mahajangana TaxID=1108764 RepID=A0ACC2JWJ6_9PEZI|nr:hypothetical protein O1611_g1722 [Lasiodiplodia mahajangana]
MDPLSITTSVITLIGAASNVYNFLQSVRHADRGFQSLVREVGTLNGFLLSIDKALEDCRDNPYALTHIDPALWKESKIALSDCQKTLDELGSLFREPKRPSRSNTLFRKARVAAELRSRAGEIASFREKISMSNMSLQTLLQVINVSLSLRSNESHDTILRELKELKNALKKSSQAATVSYSALFLNEKDARLVHHLKGLIRAANEFHTSASTTASTVAGETQPPPTDFGDDDARSGIHRMPSMKRKQIETYLSQNEPVSRASTSASDRKTEVAASPDLLKSSEAIPETREVDSSHTFSTIFTSGFSKIAQRALQQLDLQKAEDLLRQALKWYSSSGSDDIHHQRRLQTQLALCYLLQGNRREAEDLILDLVDSSVQQDTIAHQLLYALALLQLHELDFEGARDNSKRLWEALQRMPHCTVLDANDAMRVLATSYQESGDSLLADAIEAELPDLRLSEPVPKMVDFLVNCEELIVGIFGLQGCSEMANSLSVVRKIHNLPIAKKPSSLQMREQLLLDTSSPVSNDPPSDADDMISTKVYPDLEDKNQPKTKKRSWSNLRAFFKPRLSRDNGIMDLYPFQTGAQESSFKLIKKVKTSHAEQTSPQESGLDCSTSGVQDLVKSKRSSSTIKGSDGQNSHNSEGESRTRECIVGQPDSNPMDTTTEGLDAHEPKQQLRRQFSFEAGVPDDVSREPVTTPVTYHEMPNNAVFELMGTSLHVEPLARVHKPNLPKRRSNDGGEPRQKRLHKIPRLNQFDGGSCPQLSRDDSSMGEASSLEMENDIYNLLGYGASVTDVVSGESPEKLDRAPSSAGSDLLYDLDAAIGGSSSESDSDTVSDSDQVTRSTRQTSFDSSYALAGSTSHDNWIGEGSKETHSYGQASNGKYEIDGSLARR